MPWNDGNENQFHIPNPDPERHYRWLDASSPKKLRRHLQSFGTKTGYSLEQGATAEETKAIAERLGLPTFFDAATNSIKSEDHYLASIPMTEHKRRIALLQQMSRDAIGASEDAYFDKASRMRHVRPFKREIEEIADRKAFAQRESTNRVGYTGPSAE